MCNNSSLSFPEVGFHIIHCRTITLTEIVIPLQQYRVQNIPGEIVAAFVD
jgi:hypothetical protein